MSDKTAFDQMPIEILFEIFDYLSCNDIIYAFFFINQRFHSMLLQHDRFFSHFTTPTFHLSFWQNLFPIQSPRIECLIITIPDFYISLDFFPNLKSVVISSPLPVDYDQLTFMVESKQFKKLTSLKIQNELRRNDNRNESFLVNKIFSDEHFLHTFELVPQYCVNSTIQVNPKFTVNLRSLSLKILNGKILLEVLHYFPNLKYLNVIFYLFNDLEEQFNSTKKFSSIKLEKLSLRVDLGGYLDDELFPVLILFLKEFSSSLNYLSLDFHRLDTDEGVFDGRTLEQQFLTFMTQLKSFHLYGRFTKDVHCTESFLSTFESEFWFDHHWTFGIYRNYYFTLPFHFDHLEDFDGLECIRSTNSIILNSLHTWSRVKSIHFHSSSQFQSNSIEQMKLKMPNVTSTNFHFISKAEINSTDFSLDNITSIDGRAENFHGKEQILFRIFPNLKSLRLSYHFPSFKYSSLPLTTKDQICWSKVQNVMIETSSEGADSNRLREAVQILLERFLEMFPNVESYIFHFPSQYSPPNLNKIFQLLNQDQFIKIFQVKHIHCYFQLIRK